MYTPCSICQRSPQAHHPLSGERSDHDYLVDQRTRGTKYGTCDSCENRDVRVVPILADNKRRRVCETCLSIISARSGVEELS